MTFKTGTINLTSSTNNSTAEIKHISMQQQATVKSNPQHVEIWLFIVILAHKVVCGTNTQAYSVSTRREEDGNNGMRIFMFSVQLRRKAEKLQSKDRKK